MTINKKKIKMNEASTSVCLLLAMALQGKYRKDYKTINKSRLTMLNKR